MLNGRTPRTDIVRIGKGIEGIDNALYLENGKTDFSTKNGNFFGYGIEKLINEHVARKGDLTLEDIVRTPELIRESQFHFENNDLVFNFPSQKDEQFRIVFSDAKKGKDLDLNTKADEQKTLISAFRTPSAVGTHLRNNTTVPSPTRSLLGDGEILPQTTQDVNTGMLKDKNSGESYFQLTDEQKEKRGI